MNVKKNVSRKQTNNFAAEVRQWIDALTGIADPESNAFFKTVIMSTHIQVPVTGLGARKKRFHPNEVGRKKPSEEYRADFISDRGKLKKLSGETSKA